jgi:hypothetical protein
LSGQDPAWLRRGIRAAAMLDPDLQRALEAEAINDPAPDEPRCACDVSSSGDEGPCGDFDPDPGRPGACFVCEHERGCHPEARGEGG